ncbi:hypothetical protein M501DRAFT_995068 [Patellaria atrata CBS 101060]|uniref:Uncharacterized protein n=1 Tax=Patellaria atrata CBS 101060 TaxID=1346257 RepID=A0A9P4VQ01_9PEZI|nr:hypothetical protein M501DRAFT_995068 [Patellaria atrata CBS 101060]
MASANRSVGNIYDNSLVLEFERKPAASTERQPSLNHRKSVDSVEGTANSASELLQSHISNEDIWKRLESLQPVGKENGGYEAVVNPKLLTFAKQKPIQPPRLPKSLPERLEIEELLSDGYASVSSDADVLRREFELIQILQKTQKPDNPDDRVDRNELSGYLIQLDRLSKGRIASVISPQPPPVRALARMIETNGNKGIDLIIDDLTLTAQWLVSEGEADNDSSYARRT